MADEHNVVVVYCNKQCDHHFKPVDDLVAQALALAETRED